MNVCNPGRKTFRKFAEGCGHRLVVNNAGTTRANNPHHFSSVVRVTVRKGGA
jgi:hypothetical protein